MCGLTSSFLFVEKKYCYEAELVIGRCDSHKDDQVKYSKVLHSEVATTSSVFGDYKHVIIQIKGLLCIFFVNRRDSCKAHPKSVLFR